MLWYTIAIIDGERKRFVNLGNHLSSDFAYMLRKSMECQPLQGPEDKLICSFSPSPPLPSQQARPPQAHSLFTYSNNVNVAKSHIY